MTRSISPKLVRQIEEKLREFNGGDLAVLTAAIRDGGFTKHSTRITTSSKSIYWNTPPSFLKLVREVIGPIGLDPSARVEREFQYAKVNYTNRRYWTETRNGVQICQSVGRTNGLVLPWRGFGGVFCNPPYGRSMVKWIIKGVSEFNDLNDRDCVGGPPDPTIEQRDALIMLVPARPDTRWFQHETLPYATGLCFWRGRLTFSGSDPAPFPSLIIYFGQRPKRFTRVFSPHGWTMTT